MGLPGHDRGIKRAADKDVWAEQLEQDSWGQSSRDRKAGDRAAGTGQLGQDGREEMPGRTAGIGQLRKTKICFNLFAKMFGIPIVS
jgi:hypothetical protein